MRRARDHAPRWSSSRSLYLVVFSGVWQITVVAT